MGTKFGESEFTTCSHGTGYWSDQEPSCVQCRNEELEAEVKRLQAENDSWEETVNAMLGPLSVKRRGKPHGPVEAVQNTVSSYEGEITELRSFLRRIIEHWEDGVDSSTEAENTWHGTMHEILDEAADAAEGE